jgi:dienelactone hydrolase
MRRNVEFPARDVTLRGWHYMPDAQSPVPIVVIAHGWSGVKEQALEQVAEHMVAAGLSALVYDQRNHGESDSPIPGHIDPWEQVHDMRHAISFAETLPGVDRNRIGVWGTSYSGAHAITVAAIDNRVKAGAAQVPMIAGLANIQRLMDTMQNWKPFMEMLNEERRRWAQGEPPAMIAVCADDPATPCVFPGPRTFNFFDSQRDTAPNWKNSCTIRSVDLALEYDPTPYLSRLGGTPFQFIVGEEDLSTPADLALEGYAKIRGPKELVMIPGDHYTSYSEYAHIALPAAANFLKKHLNREFASL